MGFFDDLRDFAAGFGGANPVAVRQQRLNEQLLPLQIQREQQILDLGAIDLDVRRFERDNILPLDQAIRTMQLTNENQRNRLTKWNARRQAGFEEAFPALGLINSIQPAAISGIVSLASQQKDYENQVALLDQQAKHDNELLDRLKAKRNEAAATLAETRGQVDAILGGLEEQNPGFSFTTRERSFLADFAAQQVESGAIAQDQVGPALQSFLASNPRVQRRLDAIPEIAAPAGPELSPLAQQVTTFREAQSAQSQAAESQQRAQLMQSVTAAAAAISGLDVVDALARQGLSGTEDLSMLPLDVLAGLESDLRELNERRRAMTKRPSNRKSRNF